MANVDGSRGKGRSKLSWMDNVNSIVERNVLNIEDARVCEHARDRWKRVLSICWLTEFHWLWSELYGRLLPLWWFHDWEFRVQFQHTKAENNLACWRLWVRMYLMFPALTTRNSGLWAMFWPSRFFSGSSPLMKKKYYFILFQEKYKITISELLSDCSENFCHIRYLYDKDLHRLTDWITTIIS
jgi:hypothetical protein